jgi:fucose permease
MPQIHIVAYCVGLGYRPAISAELLSIILSCGVISRLMFGFLANQIGGIRTLMIRSRLKMFSLFYFLLINGLVSLYVVSAVFGLSQGKP